MLQIIIIETIYLLLIVIPSMTVFFRTRSLYRFSSYKGLMYYSSAFLFLSLGFLIRYLIMLSRIFEGNLDTIKDFGAHTLIMEFFLILPGFFLLYSMIWHRFEKHHYSSRHTIAQLIIYTLAIIIAASDTSIRSFYLMYASQIAVFLIASIISLKKYLKNKNNFLQLHFIAMIMFLIVWSINLIAQQTIDIIPMMRLYAYLATVAGCMILLHITLKLTSDRP